MKNGKKIGLHKRMGQILIRPIYKWACEVTLDPTWLPCHHVCHVEDAMSAHPRRILRGSLAWILTKKLVIDSTTKILVVDIYDQNIQKGHVYSFGQLLTL